MISAASRTYPISAMLRHRFILGGPALMGEVLLLFVFVVAIIGPGLVPYNPFDISGEVLQRPDPAHILGTDQLGRDILSRVIYGSRATLWVGLAAAALALVLGTSVGSLAGYFGGMTDSLLMRLTEFFQVIPRFFLALLVVALFGSGLDRVILVIGGLSWPVSARLARAGFLRLKEEGFVEAARAVGSAESRIILRHILPNALGPLLIQGSLEVAQAILLEAGLGFLGVSDPHALTWGSMVRDSPQFLTTAWWVGVVPGAAIFFSVLAVNLVGDALNDMLEPGLK